MKKAELERAGPEVQAAAVRRVEARDAPSLSAQGAASEPGVSAALCSMAVQDIGIEAAGCLGRLCKRQYRSETAGGSSASS